MGSIPIARSITSDDSAGKVVRRLREQRKLSQEKLAELAGIHPTYLGRIERGRQNISLVNIGKIARALKVKPRELLKGVA